MTQHTDLIERLRYEPTASQYLSLSDLIASLHEDRKNAANAMEAQAREIERLRKDAALVAARERERVANLVLTTDTWRNAGWVSTICPITTQAIAAAIRALNTEGEGNDRP